MIARGAQLGSNVEVGPYAVIDSGVTVGDDCTIQAHAILTDHVTFGARNLVGFGAVIGSAPQDYAHTNSIASSVTVGNDNSFREYVTIHRGTEEGTSTWIGSNNLLMGGVHVGHNCVVGGGNVIANNCLLAGYVHLGDDAVLGGGAVFHQGLRIGDMVMIRGGTAWSKDIPPFTVGEIINTVCGINAVGMRRKGVDADARAEVKRAYQLLYRSGLNVTQAVEASRSSEWGPAGQRFLAFVAEKSRRGLCNARGRSRSTESP